MSKQQLQVTPAAAWRKEDALVRLPSGRVVRAKEVDVAGLILNSEKGEVPDFLRAQMNAKMTGKKSGPVMVDVDDLRGVSSLMNVIVRAAVIEPRIVKEGADYDRGEINLEDIGTEDKMYLFNLVMPAQEMDVALSFRQRVEAANMGLVQDVQGDGQQTEPTADTA